MFKTTPASSRTSRTSRRSASQMTPQRSMASQMRELVGPGLQISTSLDRSLLRATGTFR